MAKTSGGAGRKAGGGAPTTPAVQSTQSQGASAISKSTQYGEIPVAGVTAHAENWFKKTKLGTGYLKPTGHGGNTGRKWRLYDSNGRTVAYSDSQKSLKEWGQKNLGITNWAAPGAVPPMPQAPKS